VTWKKERDREAAGGYNRVINEQVVRRLYRALGFVYYNGESES
jgi:hypothetical protein